MQMSHSTQVLSESLAELRISVTHVQELSSGVGELDSAIRVVRGLGKECFMSYAVHILDKILAPMVFSVSFN